MTPLPRSLYLVFVFALTIVLAACGPVGQTATPQATSPSLAKSIAVPNPAAAAGGPVFATTCVPPAPQIADVNSYCANPIKGVGGVTYSDTTTLAPDGSTGSWLVGDSVSGGASCNLDNGTSSATCYGPSGSTIQAMICSSCAAPLATAQTDVVCAKGFALEADQKTCGAVDPQFYTHYTFCPTGSQWNNAKQACIDDATKKPASLCPPDHPIYDPGNGRCVTSAQNVYNCQSFPVKLGVCQQPAPAVLNVVQFCQNNAASQGGVNIRIPAGSKLNVDVQANKLGNCTLSEALGDGSHVLTCWGPASASMDGTLCSDPANPASCQPVSETLGGCAGKPNPADVPAKPACKPSSTAVCP